MGVFCLSALQRQGGPFIHLLLVYPNYIFFLLLTRLLLPRDQPAQTKQNFKISVAQFCFDSCCTSMSSQDLYKADNMLTKNQKKKMQKKRKVARESCKKLEMHMEREKVNLNLMLAELENYEYNLEVDRTLELLENIKNNDEFIAIQKRKVEKKAGEEEANLSVQEKRDNLEALEDLAKLMITSGRISGAEDMNEVFVASKAKGKIPRTFLEGIQEGLDQCVNEQYLENWRPSVVFQGELSEEMAKQKIETEIKQRICGRETENIKKNLGIKEHHDDKTIKSSKNDKNQESEYKTKNACNSSSCSEDGLYLCSGCCLVSYCSVPCSRKEWRHHREDCRRERQGREGEGQTELD